MITPSTWPAMRYGSRSSSSSGVLRQEQDKLLAPSGQRRAHPAEDLGKEGISKDARRRLGDDHADRAAAAGHQGPRRRIGDEAEALDRALDLALRFGVDPRVAVDHTRDGGLRDAREASDLVHRHTAVAGPLGGWHRAGRLSVCECAFTEMGTPYNRLSRMRFHELRACRRRVEGPLSTGRRLSRWRPSSRSRPASCGSIRGSS